MSGIPLLLLGAGGHARSCIDVIEQAGRYQVVGLVGTRDEVGRRVLGYPVVGSDENLDTFLVPHRAVLVAVGQITTPDIRIRLFESLEAARCEAPSILSPRAYVSRHARIGEGSIIMPGAIVNAGAVIGRNCIINSMALIEHDAQIGAHSHIATGAIVNGGVHVGDASFVGSGTCIRQGIEIGDRCVIGMGQRVMDDCPSGAWLPPRRSTV